MHVYIYGILQHLKCFKFHYKFQKSHILEWFNESAIKANDIHHNYLWYYFSGLDRKKTVCSNLIRSLFTFTLQNVLLHDNILM